MLAAFTPCSSQELEQVDGGMVDPFSVFVGVLLLLLACGGRDAEEDRTGTQDGHPC